MTAWLHQGVYGEMTKIAKFYQISRTFLYQLLFMANLQLETLFSDEKPVSKRSLSLRTAHHVVTLGREMLAAEYRFDFAGSGIPPPLRSDISANFSTARVRHFLPPS